MTRNQDYSGNALTLTEVGTPNGRTSPESKFQTGYDFDGVDDALTSTSTSFKFTDVFSFAAVLELDNPSTDNVEFLLCWIADGSLGAGEHWDDFKFQVRGDGVPSGWTNQFNSAQTTWNVSSGISPWGWNNLRFLSGTAVHRAVSLDAAGSPADVQIRTADIGGGSLRVGGCGVRGSGTASSPSGYFVEVDHDSSSNNVKLIKLVNGTRTILNQVTDTTVTNQSREILMEATGTTIRAKVWLMGAAEPGAWTVTATDSSHASGWVGLWSSNLGSGASITWGFFSVGAPPLRLTPRPVYYSLFYSNSRIVFYSDRNNETNLANSITTTSSSTFPISEGFHQVSFIRNTTQTVLSVEGSTGVTTTEDLPTAGASGKLIFGRTEDLSGTAVHKLNGGVYEARFWSVVKTSTVLNQVTSPSDNTWKNKKVGDELAYYPFEPDNITPHAEFTTTPNGTNNYDFDSTGSSDLDGTIASRNWNFGDGGTATGITASHTYFSNGNYTVTLEIVDNLGASDTATFNIGQTSVGTNFGGGQNASNTALPITFKRNQTEASTKHVVEYPILFSAGFTNTNGQWVRVQNSSDTTNASANAWLMAIADKDADPTNITGWQAGDEIEMVCVLSFSGWANLDSGQMMGIQFLESGASPDSTTGATGSGRSSVGIESTGFFRWINKSTGGTSDGLLYDITTDDGYVKIRLKVKIGTSNPELFIDSEKVIVANIPNGSVVTSVPRIVLFAGSTNQTTASVKFHGGHYRITRHP